MTTPPTPAEPVLRIDDLSVSFRSRTGSVPAVRNVSIEVFAGETVAVVGASGSGKSTTAAAVNRLLPTNGVIDGGRITFAGQDVAALPESRMVQLRGAGIGLVPQDPMSNLNPVQRIGDQIGEALEAHGRTTGRATRPEVLRLLEAVGIDDPDRRRRQYPHEFSGGMRQRVLIAMGLACRPRLLIADEPTSALDVTVQRRVLDLLGELTTELGTAVFLITHDLALAAERADRVVVMHEGTVVESGEPRTVLTDPQHPYTRQLISAAPSLTSSHRRRPADRQPHDDDRPSLLRVDTLRKDYPLDRRGRDRGVFTAVDGISFRIARGTTVSIVGESGSGKSTTANLVLGLETPTSGSVQLDGREVTGRGRKELFAMRRRVQPVFQNPYASLDPRYTIGDSIAEPLRVHRVGSSAERRERVTELLEQVALPRSVVQRLPHELSGGQRQRVAIARALALQPELVVLDEAVSALDVLVQAQILELLASLQERLGLAYLFISHDLAVVRMISDEVHVMRRGQIVESGSPQAIFAQPQHQYTQELLDAIPRMSPAA